MDSNDRLVVPPNNMLKKQIMHAYHDGLSRHPGQERKILNDSAGQAHNDG
jgi:hypothetical protein